MKILRIGLAFILTIVLLYISRNTSRGRPEFESYLDNGISFEMMTVPKATEFETARLTVSVAGELPEEYRVVYRQAKRTDRNLTKFDTYSEYYMLPDTVAGQFYHETKAGAKGGRHYYIMEVQDMQGVTLARFVGENGQPFFLKFIGAVPGYILIPHIFLMFATVYCIVLAALHAVSVIKDKADPRSMTRLLFWGTLCAFLGGYPFGFGMNWFAFDVIWEGVPFGTDATDNKTQLLFLSFLFVLLSSLGTLTRGRLGHDLFRPQGLARLTVTALALMFLIYLIPHSIQFTPALTYTVCYSYIGLLFVLYLIARVTRKRRLGGDGG